MRDYFPNHEYIIIIAKSFLIFSGQSGQKMTILKGELRFVRIFVIKWNLYQIISCDWNNGVKMENRRKYLITYRI